MRVVSCIIEFWNRKECQKKMLLLYFNKFSKLSITYTIKALHIETLSQKTFCWRQRMEQYLIWKWLILASAKSWTNTHYQKVTWLLQMIRERKWLKCKNYHRKQAHLFTSLRRLLLGRMMDMKLICGLLVAYYIR